MYTFSNFFNQSGRITGMAGEMPFEEALRNMRWNNIHLVLLRAVTVACGP